MRFIEAQKYEKNGCPTKRQPFHLKPLYENKFLLDNDDALGDFTIGGENAHHVNASFDIQVDVDRFT